MSDEVQHIKIFLDDSGIFTSGGSDNYFIYAGYVFLSGEERSIANREYRTLSDAIRTEVGHSGELKASMLQHAKHRRALVNVLKRYESVAAVVNLTRIKPYIMANKLSIHRYKDYAIKIAIKRKLDTLISAGKLQADMKTELDIFIDEQHTSTDGYYNLKESILEELAHGVRNYDYGTFHPPLFSNGLTVKVQFCNSAGNYLVQASDLLANRMNRSFNHNDATLRQMSKIHIVTLP